MNAWRLAVLLVLALSCTATVADLQIRDVRHDRDSIDPGGKEPVSIHYSLTEPADVTLNFFDGRDLLIRSISGEGAQVPGEHTLAWNGRDQADRPVPPGAYHYTLVAENAAGERVEHDITDLTGGQNLEVMDISWDHGQGEIHYVLTGTARVSVRIGLEKGGPLLRTLIDWVPRHGGAQTESWDGMDQSGVLDLSKHPSLVIAVQAFALSDNTLLVGSNEDRNILINKLPWGETRREVKRQPEKRMYAHAQQPLESRGDFSIKLKLPAGLKRNRAGVPIVTGRVPVRLDIDDGDRARALARRFEPVFYLDGTFVFENEAGFLPTTWNWDTATVNPGIHYLTANLRGYEGNFGIATVKVDVHREQNSDAD